MYALVAREHHHDGHLHLHAVVIFKKRVDVTTGWMERVGGKAGNAIAIRPTSLDVCRSLAYCVKESGMDGFTWDEFGVLPATYRNHPAMPPFLLQACGFENRFTGGPADDQQGGGGGGARPVGRPRRVAGFPPVRVEKEKKVAKTDALVDALTAGVTDTDLLKGELRGAFLIHGRRCSEVRTTLSSAARLASLTPWRPIPVYLGMDASLASLANWLNTNCDRTVLRPVRQQQLWLWGPTAIGKSSMILWLNEFHLVYDAPTDEDFFDDLSDAHTLISFDEMASHHKLTTLNHLIDGSHCRVKQKGRQFLKTKNVPVIFTSNFSPEQAYPNASRDNTDSFRAFLARLVVIHIEQLFFPQPLLRDWR